MGIQAVIFDMDGVLLDSEAAWDAAREAYTRESGGTWRETAQKDMMGMSSTEWSRYMQEELDVPADPEQISSDVVEKMLAQYQEQLPLIDGAVEAVHRLADAFSLAVASSSNRPLIETVLREARIDDRFDAVVSSEEVASGKPAPDVYLEASRRLRVDPTRAAAIEDSSNGIRAAHAAGMRVIAVPNTHYPPSEDALALAAVVAASPAELTPELVRG
jgi:HAD superfamily hydrolase (TIGR01509 family)